MIIFPKPTLFWSHMSIMIILIPDLIDTLRKPGTVMFCNSASASKVRWAQVMKAGDVKTTGNHNH